MAAGTSVAMPNKLHEPVEQLDCDSNFDIESQNFVDDVDKHRLLGNSANLSNGTVYPSKRLLSISNVEPPFKLLCFDLSWTPAGVRLVILSSGVLLFFLLNAWVEEYLFRSISDFKFGWYMTFFELFCFSGFAILERYAFGDDGQSVFAHQASYKRHFIVAIAMTASRGLTNVSLQYLNYPTQVIFKSMKLITVMIGSIIYLKQSFLPMEYLSAFLLVTAASLFSLGDFDVASTSDIPVSYIGLFIVVLSLVFDAAHANTQDALVRTYNASTLEAMLFTNMFAACLTFATTIVIGELGPALIFCAQHPIAYVLFVLRAMVIYGGVLCYIMLVKSFGAVTATAVTTVRKIMTILASFMFFPKPFNSKYLLGFMAFALSVMLSAHVVKQQKAKKAYLNSQK